MTRDLLTGLWSATQAPQFSPREWELLLAQARASRLLARLAHLYADRGWLDAVPAAPRRHLTNAQRFAERLHHEVSWETDHLLAALAALPTPIVLLKGAAYVRGELPPARGRVFSDVDIMVRRDQLGAVEQALFRAGWIPEKLPAYDDRYYRTWMHELPPLQHVHRRTQLDVHHTIAPPTSRFAVDGERLLAQAQPLPDEPRLGTLAPVDMVLHSAVHLMQDGDFSGGLRDLLDLGDLLCHFGRSPAFWPALIARARELRATTPLFHALAQVRRITGIQAPADVQPAVRAMAPSALPRRAMSALLVIALRPDHVSCDGPATGLARWLLYVRSHWLRMPWYQIAPHLLRKAAMRAMTRRDAPAPPTEPDKAPPR